MPDWANHAMAREVALVRSLSRKTVIVPRQ
jgi:hypothetical protein